MDNNTNNNTNALDQLKKLRDEGRTISEIARMIEASESQVHKWLSGKNKMGKGWQFMIDERMKKA